MIKDMDAGNDWMCGHKSVPNTHYISINQSVTQQDASDRWNDTSPTSSVITLGSAGHVNGRGGPSFICYAWTSIEGFSKFDHYVGNGEADGPYIYTGFKPALLIMKAAISNDATNWQMLDNDRSPFNATNQIHLRANNNAAEFTNYPVDLLSNGFKIKNTDADMNANGNRYVYMAWSEMPFKHSTGR